jgi:WD40 repeat protein
MQVFCQKYRLNSIYFITFEYFLFIFCLREFYSAIELVGNFTIGNISRATVNAAHCEKDLCELAQVHTFFGHRGAITAFAASPAFGILASGSSDRSVILWDINRMVMLLQLPLHPVSISAIAINTVTGDIVTCSGACAFVWSQTGSLTACNHAANGISVTTTDTCELAVGRIVSAALSSRDLILSVTFVCNPKESADVYIVTGHADGAVRFWKLEFAQNCLKAPVSQVCSAS